MGSVFVDCKDVYPSKRGAAIFLRVAIDRLGLGNTMTMVACLKAAEENLSEQETT